MVKLENQVLQVRARLKKFYGQKEFTKTDLKAEIVSIKDAPLTLAEQDIIFNNLNEENWIERCEKNSDETFCLTKKALDETSLMRIFKIPLLLLRA